MLDSSKLIHRKAGYERLDAPFAIVSSGEVCCYSAPPDSRSRLDRYK